MISAVDSRDSGKTHYPNLKLQFTDCSSLVTFTVNYRHHDVTVLAI